MKVKIKTGGIKKQEQDVMTMAFENIVKVCTNALSLTTVTKFLADSDLPFEQRIFDENQDLKDYIKDMSC